VRIKPNFQLNLIEMQKASVATICLVIAICACAVSSQYQRRYPSIPLPIKSASSLSGVLTQRQAPAVAPVPAPVPAADPAENASLPDYMKEIGVPNVGCNGALDNINDEDVENMIIQNNTVLFHFYKACIMADDISTAQCSCVGWELRRKSMKLNDSS
jgi:hypothetical protein